MNEFRVVGEMYQVNPNLRACDATLGRWDSVALGDAGRTGPRVGDEVRIEQTFGAAKACLSVAGGKTWTADDQRQVSEK